MKIYSGIVLASVLSASLVCAENLTQANVEKANEVIEAAVEVFGGDDRLSDISSIVVQHESVNVAVGQSHKAEPPWDRNPTAGITAVDLGNGRFVTKNSGSGSGFEFDNGTIIDGEASAQLDYRAGTFATIAEPDFDTASGPFMRVTPAMLVRQVRDRAQNAYYLGETTVDGEAYEVVGFSMAVGPAISLYFEKDSHMLRRSERVLPGFGLVEYRFHDYEIISGIPFNKKFELYLNGDQNVVRTNLKTRVNVPLDDLMIAESSLRELPAVVADELARHDIAEGVYLIGGNGTYAMFVEMDDYVIAAGGAAGISDRIELLREVVADKPVKYGVLTHHHFDHVLGVSVYEEEGATVVAAKAHENVVREAADNGELLNLETVNDRMEIRDSSRRVQVIDIGPTAHTEHLLVTWLPEEGILFEADHFSMPRAGSVGPAVTSTRTLAAALKENGIQPRLMLSAHSPRPGTMQDLQESLNKGVVMVSKE